MQEFHGIELPINDGKEHTHTHIFVGIVGQNTTWYPRHVSITIYAKPCHFILVPSSPAKLAEF